MIYSVTVRVWCFAVVACEKKREHTSVDICTASVACGNLHQTRGKDLEIIKGTYVDARNNCDGKCYAPTAFDKRNATRTKCLGSDINYFRLARGYYNSFSLTLGPRAVGANRCARARPTITSCIINRSPVRGLSTIRLNCAIARDGITYARLRPRAIWFRRREPIPAISFRHA